MTFAGVNHWAILVAAVAGWIAGAGWYMTLGKYWQAALGMTAEQMEACKKKPHSWVPFVLAFVANVLIAWALAGLLGHFGEVTLKDGAITGALCWLGFVITTMTVNNAFGMRSYRLTAIDGGHYLLVFVLMGAIIGAIGV